MSGGPNLTCEGELLQILIPTVVLQVQLEGDRHIVVIELYVQSQQQHQRLEDCSWSTADTKPFSLFRSTLHRVHLVDHQYLDHNGYIAGV